MKIDNVFIVESPLQALAAVELNLILQDEKNAIIYRITGRKVNDTQVQNVISLVKWNSKTSFDYSSRFAYLVHSRKFYQNLSVKYENVKRTFFGEFRAQWMHFARFCIRAEKDFLMDDGAATLYAKKEFMDKGEFYPKNTLFKKDLLRKIYRTFPVFGLIKQAELNYKFNFASAFVNDVNGFNIDFKNIKEIFHKSKKTVTDIKKKMFYFGSKHSESGLISLDYEIIFLTKVLGHYDKKGLETVYIAHRDESLEKLEMVKKIGFSEVLRLDVPAEIYFIENNIPVIGFSSAFSSVLNNFIVMFPDISTVSFELDYHEIHSDFIIRIRLAYDHLRERGIKVITV